MAALIDTAAVRASVDLAALVGRHVRLCRHHDNWSGLCPFHAEKSPSFYVYPDGFFHCFGCGAHGDCLDFVMQLDGVDFREAAVRLGADAVDGRELARRQAERAAEARRRDAAQREAFPWAALEAEWKAEQAARWRPEIAEARRRVYPTEAEEREMLRAYLRG